MNNKKRKVSEDDESFDSKDVKEISNSSNEKLNCSTNCENDDSGNSKDEEKTPDNGGGSSEKPSTSDDKVVIDDTKDNSDESSEPDKKKTKTDTETQLGTLLFCGGTNWDLIGRKELPKNAKNAVGANLWGPHRLASLNGTRVASVYAGCCAVHSVLISDCGQAYTWGRNDKGQLGHSDTKRRDVPTLVETLKDNTIVSASCGRGHTLFLTDRGTVYSCGDNKMGQCGTGSQNTTITAPSKIDFKGRSIAKVACGAEFSVIVDVCGGMYSFGCPEYGQLGHNTDGRYFVTSHKLSFRCELSPRRIIAFIEQTREGHVTLVDDVQITNVACGINHSVAIDSKKRCFSWGFGGYGRLGHTMSKDEMVPRLIKTFDSPNTGRGVKKIFAGGTYSMAINVHDVLYFWGQNKRAGEATMYPKPVPDLVGWQVRDVGCGNCSIVVVTTENVISWGPSPTHGELGYGESRPKSSTTPQEVKPLDGIYIHSVAMGYGHTLLIARDETEADKKRLEQIPEYTP